MQDIAKWISCCVSDFDAHKDYISDAVQNLCAKFPIY